MRINVFVGQQLSSVQKIDAGMPACCTPGAPIPVLLSASFQDAKLRQLYGVTCTSTDTKKYFVFSLTTRPLGDSHARAQEAFRVPRGW